MKQTITVTTDDIDGQPDARTYTIGINGDTFEIDLAADNAEKLEALLAPYREAGRRIANGRRQPPRKATPMRALAALAAKEEPEPPEPEEPEEPDDGADALPPPPPPPANSPAAIRQWWNDNPEGLPTWQAKGAIPAAVLRAWEKKQ